MFTERIFDLGTDYEGPIRAVLTEAKPTEAVTKAVLYLHGYIDYFFQDHMAAEFTARGWNFYALDLRKYGRALQAHQHPNYCRSLYEYFPEIDRAIQHMLSEHNDRILLLGHSTGGLLASLYAAEGDLRHKIDCLVLNSPFLEFNTTRFKQKIAIPLSALISRWLPYARKKNELSPNYGASVHRSIHGEWSFNLAWKPIEGIPLYFAWLGAILQAQRKLHRGLHISIPILVMHSDASSFDKQWSERARHTDTVLNVEHIRRYAPMLGDRVTDITIKNGMHDLFLSSLNVRNEAFALLFAWLDEHLRQNR